MGWGELKKNGGKKLGESVWLDSKKLPALKSHAGNPRKCGESFMHAILGAEWGGQGVRGYPFARSCATAFRAVCC